MPAWLPLLVSFLGVSSWAESIECQMSACQAQASDLSSVELTSEARGVYLKSQVGSSLEIPVPNERCHYRNQEVILAYRNPEGLPLWWGRASVRNIHKTNETTSRLGLVILERSLTETVVAPDCTNRCHRVIDKLPSAQNAKIFDLRPSRMTSTVPFPGITRLTGTYTAANLTTVLGSDLEQRLVFMTQNNQIEYVRPLFQLMQTAYQAGYKNIEWYYSGMQGFRGWYLPHSPPSTTQIMGVDEVRDAVKKTAVLAFVPDFDGKMVTALNGGSSMRGVPWTNKKFRVKEFNFSQLPQRKDTQIIFVQKDATALHVYEAANAARAIGYSNVAVLPGGVYELEIVR